ncbi:MAG: SEC-C metal-binding domain-containing protein [Bdellovibrionota bacterium]
MRAQPQQQPALDLSRMARAPRQMQMSRGPMGSPLAAAAAGPGMMAPAPSASAVAKAGRNDPCPCGSGKKYKKCHGANG